MKLLQFKREARTGEATKEAWRDICCFGSEGFRPEYLLHYEVVATIDTANEDVAFEVLNGYVREATKGIEVKRVAPMNSMSVGDILLKDTGLLLMCDPAGWKAVGKLGVA